MPERGFHTHTGRGGRATPAFSGRVNTALVCPLPSLLTLLHARAVGERVIWCVFCVGSREEGRGVGMEGTLRGERQGVGVDDAQSGEHALSLFIR